MESNERFAFVTLGVCLVIAVVSVAVTASKAAQANAHANGVAKK